MFIVYENKFTSVNPLSFVFFHLPNHSFVFSLPGYLDPFMRPQSFISRSLFLSELPLSLLSFNTNYWIRLESLYNLCSYFFVWVNRVIFLATFILFSYPLYVTVFIRILIVPVWLSETPVWITPEVLLSCN